LAQLVLLDAFRETGELDTSKNGVFCAA